MRGKAHSVGGGESEVRRVGPQFPFLKNGDRSEAPGQTGDIEPLYNGRAVRDPGSQIPSGNRPAREGASRRSWLRLPQPYHSQGTIRNTYRTMQGALREGQ